jgi:alpha-ketoglutarate-dependent taurine dioxygenase
MFNELAASDELRLDYMLQPGEIQLLNNHTQLHARSEFQDWEDVDRRRHLLRWG